MKLLIIQASDSDAKLTADRMLQIARGTIVDARSAIDVLEDVEGHGFDVVLLDPIGFNSPPMEWIQQIVDQYPDLPLVVLCRSADAEFTRQALQAGAQDLFPLSNTSGEAMLHAVEVAIQRKQLPAGHRDSVQTACEAKGVPAVKEFGESMEDSVAAGCQGSLNVLVAEDSLVNQRLAAGLLTRAGHQVTIARNGQDAVNLFQSRPFDLVLMDVQMPEMDGLEATRQIRKLESGSDRRVPVLAMTGHGDSSSRSQCLDAGMDDYLAKPISADLVYEKIQKLTSGEAIDTIRMPAAELDVGAVPAGSDLTVEQLLESVGGSRRIAIEVASAFLQEYPSLMSEASQAIRDGDSELLRNRAHTLQGALRVLPAEDARELALELETMGINEQLENATQVFEALASRGALLCQFLESYLQAPSEE